MAPRYVGPFQIQQQCGPVAYRVKLPDHMSAVHDIFHVSQLKKCLQVPDQVIDLGDVKLEPNLTIAEYPIRVLDQKDRVTRSSSTKYNGINTLKMKLLGSPRIT